MRKTLMLQIFRRCALAGLIPGIPAFYFFRNYAPQEFAYPGLVVAGLLCLVVIAVALAAASAASAVERDVRSLRLTAESRNDHGGRRRFSAGSSDEARRLAETLTHWSESSANAENDRQRRRTIDNAVLAGLTEGVIVFDSEERILDLSPATVQMLSLGRDDPRGKLVQEAVRSTEVQQMVVSSLEGASFERREVVLRAAGEKTLEARCLPLEGIGGILFLQDLSRLKRLESIRQDFVANVSHELRTPITSIKGFVETLLDSPADSPEVQQKFLEIIRRQSIRLSGIIDDLMALARIESSERASALPVEELLVSDIIRAAAETCAPSMDKKGIALEVLCDRELAFFGNRSLLEQALVNLIVNATRYSAAGSRIRISVALDGELLRLSVSDNGIGIAREHLPRLFERFYRIDRSRDRQDGGSGLGLSIVKHIALAHRGDVEVESTLGKGSTFSLLLPRDKAPA